MGGSSPFSNGSREEFIRSAFSDETPEMPPLLELEQPETRKAEKTMTHAIDPRIDTPIC
jgi:hypothetical protein